MFVKLNYLYLFLHICVELKLQTAVLCHALPLLIQTLVVEM